MRCDKPGRINLYLEEAPDHNHCFSKPQQKDLSSSQNGTLDLSIPERDHPIPPNRTNIKIKRKRVPKQPQKVNGSLPIALIQVHALHQKPKQPHPVTVGEQSSKEAKKNIGNDIRSRPSSATFATTISNGLPEEQNNMTAVS